MRARCDSMWREVRCERWAGHDGRHGGLISNPHSVAAFYWPDDEPEESPPPLEWEPRPSLCGPRLPPLEEKWKKPLMALVWLLRCVEGCTKQQLRDLADEMGVTRYALDRAYGRAYIFEYRFLLPRKLS